jgi:hypothetical protein
MSDPRGVSEHEANLRRWYKARHQELRELMWDWDPLGLLGAPDDEYDSVVDRVLSVLVNGGDSRSVGDALRGGLEHMAGEGYSAATAERHAEASLLDPFVRRVCKWWGKASACP